MKIYKNKQRFLNLMPILYRATRNSQKAVHPTVKTRVLIRKIQSHIPFSSLYFLRFSSFVWRFDLPFARF
jgi:hypothetical protein